MRDNFPFLVKLKAFEADALYPLAETLAFHEALCSFSWLIDRNALMLINNHNSKDYPQFSILMLLSL